MTTIPNVRVASEILSVLSSEHLLLGTMLQRTVSSQRRTLFEAQQPDQDTRVCVCVSFGFEMAMQSDALELGFSLAHWFLVQCASKIVPEYSGSLAGSLLTRPLWDHMQRRLIACWLPDGNFVFTPVSLKLVALVLFWPQTSLNFLDKLTIVFI